MPYGWTCCKCGGPHSVKNCPIHKAIDLAHVAAELKKGPRHPRLGVCWHTCGRAFEKDCPQCVKLQDTRRESVNWKVSEGVAEPEGDELTKPAEPPAVPKGGKRTTGANLVLQRMRQQEVDALPMSYDHLPTDLRWPTSSSSMPLRSAAYSCSSTAAPASSSRSPEPHVDERADTEEAIRLSLASNTEEAIRRSMDEAIQLSMAEVIDAAYGEPDGGGRK